MSRKFSDDELLELYRQGLTNRQIADTLQVSQPAVHYRLQKLGLKNNCQGHQAVDVKQVQTLHGMGLTNIGIAVLLQVNVRTVSEHIKGIGLEDNYYQLRRMFAS
jgi:DNA-binding NarL/FixJ family response regulator